MEKRGKEGRKSDGNEDKKVGWREGKERRKNKEAGGITDRNKQVSIEWK